MSLHLIESKKLSSSSNRKRGGTTASFVLHGVLIVCAFTAASAAPVLPEQRIPTDIVYVAPPPPPLERRFETGRSSGAQTSCNCPEIVPTPDIFRNLLLVEMPQYSVDVTLDPPPPDFSGRGGGATEGRGRGDGGHGVGISPNTGVLSEAQVELPVAILSGYRTPRYPESLRMAGVEETLSATFVVDTLGRIESGSLEFPSVRNPQFIASVCEALANARFKPAEVHGMRVRQRVMQAFVFSLQRD